MSKDRWDAILASAPLNATAGAVTSKGYEFKPARETTEARWDGPPKMVPHIADELHPDLTGRVVGRLTVVGKLAWKMNGDTIWVCRCACGIYVGRRTRSIKKAVSTECNECNYTGHLRWAASSNRARERAESEKAKKW